MHIRLLQHPIFVELVLWYIRPAVCVRWSARLQISRTAVGLYCVSGLALLGDRFYRKNNRLHPKLDK